jgi:hypothetical protein
MAATATVTAVSPGIMPPVAVHSSANALFADTFTMYIVFAIHIANSVKSKVLRTREYETVREETAMQH